MTTDICYSVILLVASTLAKDLKFIFMKSNRRCHGDGMVLHFVFVCVHVGGKVYTVFIEVDCTLLHSG